VVEAGETLKTGWDFNPHVGAEEADAVAGGGRFQLEAHRLARMQTDSGAADLSPECPSVAHHRCLECWASKPDAGAVIIHNMLILNVLIPWRLASAALGPRGFRATRGWPATLA
jgi:hypothetical protein